MDSFSGRDLISISDLAKHEIEEIFRIAAQAKSHSLSCSLKGKILASCFFEPSTRTRLSFESAMLRLGGSVIGFSEGQTTSAQKGESLQDGMRVIGSLSDLVVVRHSFEGAARVAADATETPVINAGDGANQHPTQTLLDLFTIQELHGKIDGLRIAIAGDLKYGRTIHSLILGLCHYSVRIYLISSQELHLPEEFASHLRKANIQFSYHENLHNLLPKLDILYMNRLQKERHLQAISSSFSLTEVNRAKPSFRILHPLPRLGELPASLDGTPYAAYFQQAQNGLYVRQALLALILGEINS